MAGDAWMAPVQLETAVHFESKMFREPTAEGRAGQETFHLSLSPPPHTPRPITSDTSLSQIGILLIKCDRSLYSLVLSLFIGMLIFVIDIVAILMRQSRFNKKGKLIFVKANRNTD